MGALASLPFDGTAAGAELELAAQPLQALFAECHNCEAVECFPSSIGLPAGWLEVTDERAANGRAALCPDCRVLVDEPSSSSSPPTTPAFVHCGFRLTHKTHLVAGFATIRLHAGGRSRPGGLDIPATFLVDRAGIQQLISELQAIDTQLAQGANGL